MAGYRLGSFGDEVLRIQKALSALNLYRGPLDGRFGGATESAVRQFQRSAGLSVDGVVGPATWAALVRAPFSSADLLSRPIPFRCLALTGSFETGTGVPDCFAGVAGDFDGQGLSLGVCQWNFGQGSLQPLLQEMVDAHRPEMEAIFAERLPILLAALSASRDESLAFARSIQDPVRHFVLEPWRGMFRALGRTPSFQEIQLDAAASLFARAAQLCRDYGVLSARALALMFDIVVQNGSISAVVREQILLDFRNLSSDLSPDDRQVARMRIVANRRAEAANPRWMEDVRARKLCCANGGGRVHGITYDLAEDYGLDLQGAVVEQ